MVQTYEDAVIKTVMWWSEKSFSTTLNQNNGDNTPTGGTTFALMNMASIQAQDEATPDKIKKFEEKLTELLMEAESGAPYLRGLDVDYHPCQKLSEAAEYAGINPSCFPCKTSTWIAENNIAMAKYQYGGTPMVI